MAAFSWLGRFSNPDRLALDFVQHLLQREQFAIRDKGHDHASSIKAACTSRAMDIDIGIVSEMVDEDMGDAGKIEASRGDIRGDEQADAS